MKPTKKKKKFTFPKREDIFLSFSTKDRKFVKKLYKTLNKKHNIAPWYSGERFYDNVPDFLIYDINKAIKESKYCIAIFSNNVVDNKWFFTEVGGFFHKETLDDRIIIPVLYEMDLGTFIKEFPIFADRFVICDYKNFKSAAKKIAKFIRVDENYEKNNPK